MKLDVDTLSTAPAAPPAAGPDRALDPPPPDPGLPEAPLPGTPWLADAKGDVAVAEGDAAQPAESPITAHISAAPPTPPIPLFDSNRRNPGRRACLAGVTEADESGEDAGEEAAQRRRRLDFRQPAALKSRPKRGCGKRLVGVCRVVVGHDGAPLLRQLCRECQPFM
ncbi:hypothetical protein GCM10027610_054470 [Dactylosporangium cerinum]